MSKILIAVLNMSITANIVAFAVILVRFLLKKAPKIFSYVLWFAVFLRLACPFSLVSATSLMPINAEIIPPAVVTSSIPQINSGIQSIDHPVNVFFKDMTPQMNPATGVKPLQLVLSIGAYIWLGGSVILILYAVIGYIRIKRKIYDATLSHDNIFISDKIPTAFVLGFIFPRIYIPAMVNDEQLDYILKHEQVHIRRRDYLIKPTAFLILAVHWYNPVVWVSYYLMSKDMEMSCDEAVLHKSNVDIRQAYSASLVNLYLHKSGLLKPLGFGEGSFKNMKERIKNVLAYKKTPRWVIVACSFLLVLFTAGFTTNSTDSISKNNCSEKIHHSTFTDYEEYGLNVEQNDREGSPVVYYNEQRVRLFVDMNADGAFICCHTDKTGIIDIRTTRNTKGQITGIENIPDDDAQEILDDMDLTEEDDLPTDNNLQELKEDKEILTSFADTPIRLEKDDLPDDLISWIDKCDKHKGMYITVYNNSYVFYCNQIRSFAWQPTEKAGSMTIALTELSKAGDGYALIAAPGYESLTVTLNGTSITKTLN